MGGVTNSIDYQAVIFKIIKDCEKLNANQALEFHNLTEKNDTRSARPDTCTAILLHAMRVREPGKGD